MRVVSILCAISHLTVAWYYGNPEPGSSTQGGVWPLPKAILYDNSFNHTISPLTFQFTSQIIGCDVIDKAMGRYKKLMFPNYYPNAYFDFPSTISNLVIDVTEGCDSGYPQLEMDESYEITVNASSQTATLTARQVWGAVRGLETFSQLVYSPYYNAFRIRCASISDSPRFPHRGVMIDSARHFLPVGVLLQNLDIMAQNKMNVFHWHIVDSESFPYTSAIYPNLSTMGAYTPTHVYSIADMKKVIDYARLRAIRVVPEFDTPGHTGSWGKAIPNLLSTCFNPQGQISELSNIIDASWEPNYQFLANFFTEVLDLFKDDYLHFGGDEVTYDMGQCWYNNPQVRQRMESLGFGSDTGKLLNYYWQKMFQIIEKARPGTKKVVWQDVLDQNVSTIGTIAHVWKGNTVADAMKEMASVTANGHKAILSSPWYLNYVKYGADWGYVETGDNKAERGMYYEQDPTGFNGTQAQKDLVLGGEAAIWGEFVDASNLIPRLWPRASAIAERLWSVAADTASADVAWPRLHEFRCRLIGRGFPAEPPNGPDYCPQEWNPTYKEL